jgi:hypothetical protein
MEVRGILVEGKSGELYLLGIGPRSTGVQSERPTIWRVENSSFTSLEETRSASSTIRDRLDLSISLAAGMTHDEHIKWAVLQAISAFLTKFFSGVRW